jgi:hypothetical protein
MRHRSLLSAGVLVMLCGGVAATQTTEAPATDARRRFPPNEARVKGGRVPNLKWLRAASTGSTAPVPGGLGAGTLYRAGTLRVTSRAELATSMIVHPQGIGVSNWLFTTATNRTELTVEVVGIYLGWTASLGVFDWSCQPDHPCPNGSTVPSWQWTRELNTLSCYFARGDDDGGHVHDLLSYVNKSARRGDGVELPANVANWRNSVLLVNQCTGEWDMVYRHDFRATQRDCSADQFACGWWGPIIETFQPDPQEVIPELGFVGTTLRHDRSWSMLGPAETDFTGPSAPWTLFHIQPNHSWTAGSFTP